MWWLMKLQQLLFRTYVIITFLLGVVTTYVPISFLNILDDLIFICMITNLIVVVKYIDFKVDFFFTAFTFLIMLSVVYALLNENSLSSTLLSLRQYKNFFVCLLISSFDKDEISFVKKVFLYSLVASIPFSIIQFILADKGNAMYFDEIVGVFGYGNSGTLSILILAYITFEFYSRLRDKKTVYGYYLLLLFPCLINETKVIFILFPILFITLTLSQWKENKALIFKLIPIMVIGLIAFDFAYQHLYQKSLIEYFDKDYLEGYLFVDARDYNYYVDVGRFQRIIYAYEYIESKGLVTLLFGEGLGTSFYGEQSQTYGLVARYFEILDLNKGSRIQVFHSIVEFGLLGTLILFLFFITSWIRIAKSNGNTDCKILALIFCVVIVFGFFYQPILTNRVIAFLAMYFIFYFFRYDSKTLKGRVN